MIEIFGLKVAMNPWAMLSLLVLGAAILAYLTSVVALSIFKRVAEKTATRMDDRFYRLLERYLFALLMVGGLVILVDAAPLPAKVLKTINRFLVVSALLMAVFLLTKTALLALRNIATRYEALENVKEPVEIFIKIVLVAVGGMIILDNLGISLTPILTTLGVGSLAVAIALQDTLGNFFAGLYIKADRPIQVGHYIRLASGEEGYVDYIGWRSARIRMLANNMVVVPNGKLVQSNIINYHLPDRELAVLVDVGVHYDSDLERVERVTREVAKEVLQTVPGGVSSFEPFIRYHTFSDSSINFTVILRGREFVDSFLIKHEFIKRLHERYQEEGITIPFPIRTLHIEPEADGYDEKQASEKPFPKAQR